jgi:hypothetical protein
MEASLMIEQVLQRMPDYVLDDPAVPLPDMADGCPVQHERARSSNLPWEDRNTQGLRVRFTP